jgi:leucine dehydrogenase
MRKYDRDEDALFDVMRLSQNMSLKNAAANLGVGGGKGVILADPQTEKTPELLKAFALAVDSLGGMYYTAEDVGMTVADLNYICQFTKYAMGGDQTPGAHGDPSMPTAYGVYLGIKTGAEIRLGVKSLAGIKIAVQGVGHVGTALVELLSKDKADVTVSDVNKDSVANVQEKFGTKAVDPDEIYDVDCEIFVPAAFGGTINESTIPRFKCKLVAGAANNQLLKETDAELLQKKDIYYVPDFIINCGGVTMGTAEVFGLKYDEAFKKIDIVPGNVREVDKIAGEKGITTHQAAVEMAWGRIQAAKNNKVK